MCPRFVRGALSASSQRRRVEPAFRRAFAAFLAGALCSALAGPAASQDDYEIGTGDVLRITVLGQADMTGTFKVDSEGLITFPILGKLKASGHSAPELERKLTTLLADGYLRRPQVSVNVEEYHSQRVLVTGEVQRPGPYALKADRSLLALIGDIGALSSNAGHEVIVIRPPSGTVLPPDWQPTPASPEPENPDGGADGATALPVHVPGAEVFRISVQELLAGNPERNILLQAGDTVYVPRAAQVYISGSVARPGPYRYQEDMTVLQALTLAGGVTDRGSSKRVKVIRMVDGRKQEVKARPSDIVQPEDSIVVPERLF